MCNPQDTLYILVDLKQNQAFKNLPLGYRQKSYHMNSPETDDNSVL